MAILVPHASHAPLNVRTNALPILSPLLHIAAINEVHIPFLVLNPMLPDPRVHLPCSEISNKAGTHFNVNVACAVALPSLGRLVLS